MIQMEYCSGQTLDNYISKRISKNMSLEENR